MKRILALKGCDQGCKVIERLQELGGKCSPIRYFNGTSKEWLYFIGMDNYIDATHINVNKNEKYHVMDIDEFDEKYPYHVGQYISFTISNSDTPHTFYDIIFKMKWDGNDVIYYTTDFALHVDDILGVEKKDNDDATDINNIYTSLSKITDSLDDEILQIKIPQNYDAHLDDNILTLKKIKYLTTYNDCFNYLKTKDAIDDLNAVHGHMSIELSKLQKLLICYKAYMKYCDDWKPNWRDNSDKYVITHFTDEFNDCIVCETVQYSSKILAFPNANIRDEFYKNFESLINSCKLFI